MFQTIFYSLHGTNDKLLPLVDPFILAHFFHRSCSFRASTSSRRTDVGSNLSLHHQGLPIAAPNLDNVFGTIDRRASSGKQNLDGEASSQLNISRQEMYSGSKDALSTLTTTNDSLRVTPNATVANVNDLTTMTTTIESSVNVADDSLNTTFAAGEATLTTAKSAQVADADVESVVKSILLRKLKSDNQNFIDKLVKEIIKDALIARTVKEYYITKFSPGSGTPKEGEGNRISKFSSSTVPSSSSHVLVPCEGTLATKELSSNVVISSRTSSANATMSTNATSGATCASSKDTHHRPQRSRRKEERSSRSTKRSRSHSEYRGRKTPTVFVRTDGFPKSNSTINSPIKKSVLYVSLSNLPHCKSYSYHDDTKSDSLEELIMEKVAAIENARSRKLHSKSLDHLSTSQGLLGRNGGHGSGATGGNNCTGGGSITNANSTTTVGEHTICSLGDLAYEIDSEYDSVELLSNYSASRMHVDFSTDELVNLVSSTANLVDSIISSNLLLHKPDDLDIESYIVTVKPNNLLSNELNDSNLTSFNVNADLTNQFGQSLSQTVECLTLPRLVLALNLNESTLF